MQSNKNENRRTNVVMPPLDAEAIARLIAPNTVYVREVGVEDRRDRPRRGRLLAAARL